MSYTPDVKLRSEGSDDDGARTRAARRRMFDGPETGVFLPFSLFTRGRRLR